MVWPNPAIKNPLAGGFIATTTGSSHRMAHETPLTAVPRASFHSRMSGGMDDYGGNDRTLGFMSKRNRLIK